MRGMKNIRIGFLIVASLWLAACNTHVHEPWVQYPSYLKQERSRSPELNQQLEQRVMHEQDR
jgi:hypothetical protein